MWYVFSADGMYQGYWPNELDAVRDAQSIRGYYKRRADLSAGELAKVKQGVR